jgi:hypothetical protein
LSKPSKLEFVQKKVNRTEIWELWKAFRQLFWDWDSGERKSTSNQLEILILSEKHSNILEFQISFRFFFFYFFLKAQLKSPGFKKASDFSWDLKMLILSDTKHEGFEFFQENLNKEKSHISPDPLKPSQSHFCFLLSQLNFQNRSNIKLN